jgi:small GTP-binding protein
MPAEGELSERSAPLPPLFAVVGRVNKGKSSVIASLIENDDVKISPRPGTTTDCVRYDVDEEGRVLFTVIDTPGFEDAPRMLHWLREREGTAADRVALVRSFVEEFSATDDFVQECKLLEPILEGAAILYVVNGEEPYRKNYEAEMEILRYTGQPAMALINWSEDGDYVEDWENALNQYFKLVRFFDAHHVTWRDRRKLLEAFQVLEPQWEEALAEALRVLETEQQRRLHEVSSIITDLLVDSLTFNLVVVLPDSTALRFEREKLEKRFHDELRQKEAKAHRAMARVYLHDLGSWAPETPMALEATDDLFSKETWSVMGLSPTTLLAITTATGAVAGGSIDAAVGMATFLTGAVLGGLSGLGIGLYELTRRFASASNVTEQAKSLLRRPKSGERIRVGPHPSLNFPFVLLGRALDHTQRVIAWAHARKELPPATEESEGVLQALSSARGRRLNRLFSKVRKSYRDVPASLRAELRAEVDDVLSETLAAEQAAGRAPRTARPPKSPTSGL